MRNSTIRRLQKVMLIGLLLVLAAIYFLAERVSVPAQRVVYVAAASLAITLAAITVLYGDEDEEGVLSGSDWRHSLISGSAWIRRLSTIGMLLIGMGFLVIAAVVGGDILQDSKGIRILTAILLAGGLLLLGSERYFAKGDDK